MKGETAKMAKEEYKTKNNLEDITNYRYGALAGEYFQEKDLDSSRVSLEKLARSLGVKDDKKVLETFIDGVFASEKGIQHVIGTFNNQYVKNLQDAKVSELGGYYSDLLNKYVSGENMENATKVLDEFKDETYGNLSKKMMQ